MEPTAVFAQLQLGFVAPIQWRYEVVRPLVLFADCTAQQRAQETETHPDTVRTLQRRFYQQGVPMGGDLPAAPEGPPKQRPSFIAAAWMDDYIGTPLQQLQIIKGWVEDGQTQEQVFTVAGDPHKRATVDKQCNRIGDGFSQRRD